MLSSMAALAAILIAVWFIKYKKRAVERDDGGGNGESMNDSNMSRKMHHFTLYSRFPSTKGKGV